MVMMNNNLFLFPENSLERKEKGKSSGYRVSSRFNGRLFRNLDLGLGFDMNRF